MDRLQELREIDNELEASLTRLHDLEQIYGKLNTLTALGLVYRSFAEVRTSRIHQCIKRRASAEGSTIAYDNRSRANAALELQLDNSIRTVHARIRQILEVPNLLLQADVDRVALQIQLLVAELQLPNMNHAIQNLQQMWAEIEAGLQAHPILGAFFEASLKEEEDQNVNGQNNPEDPVEMELEGPPLL